MYRTNDHDGHDHFLPTDSIVMAGPTPLELHGEMEGQKVQGRPWIRQVCFIYTSATKSHSRTTFKGYLDTMDFPACRSDPLPRKNRNENLRLG